MTCDESYTTSTQYSPVCLCRRGLLEHLHGSHLQLVYDVPTSLVALTHLVSTLTASQIHFALASAGRLTIHFTSLLLISYSYHPQPSNSPRASPEWSSQVQPLSSVWPARGHCIGLVILVLYSRPVDCLVICALTVELSHGNVSGI